MAFSRNLRALIVAATAAVAGSAMAADSGPAPAPTATGCPSPDNKDAVAYIKNPKWLHHPSSDEVNSVYPQHARKEGKTDRTVMDCAISDAGSLQDCGVVDDKRPGLGFDKASLSLARLYKMSPLAEQPAFTNMPECIRKLGAPHVVIPMDWAAFGTSWSDR
jgi:hypothetical protein